MSPKFNFVVCSIEESHDIDFLSIDELQSSLFIHEYKINQQNKEKQTLNASIEDNQTGGRGGGNYTGRGRGKSTNGKGSVKICTKIIIIIIFQRFSLYQIQRPTY